MSFDSILDECFDANDDGQYSLTRKEKRKSQAKARMTRKKLNEWMYEDALEIVNDHRLERNLDMVDKSIKTRNPRFAAKLAAILEEEEEWDMQALYQTFEDVLLTPYEEVVSVTKGEVTKDIAITTVGSDVSAVGHKADATLMKVMLELKAKAGKEKVKRKRRRGPCQSTQLGRSGVTVGILLQRDMKLAELKALEKEENDLIKEVDQLESVLLKATELKQAAPNGYWKWDLKGKKREALAKLFEVYKSSSSAAAEENALKELNLTKDKVDNKISELRIRVQERRVSGQPLIAQRREAEDFLESIAAHANVEADNVVAEADDIGEIDS